MKKSCARRGRAELLNGAGKEQLVEPGPGKMLGTNVAKLSQRLGTVISFTPDPEKGARYEGLLSEIDERESTITLTDGTCAQNMRIK
jgi:hypothetical protein